MFIFSFCMALPPDIYLQTFPLLQDIWPLHACGFQHVSVFPGSGALMPAARKTSKRRRKEKVAAVGTVSFECVGGWMQRKEQKEPPKRLVDINASQTLPQVAQVLFCRFGTFRHDHLSERASRSVSVARTPVLFFFFLKII